MIDPGTAPWWGIALMHVRPDRRAALTSETTTLLKQVADEKSFLGASIFGSRHGHRVIELVAMSDHALWHKLDNLRTHLPPQDPRNRDRLHDIAESRDGHVFAVRAQAGDMTIEPGSHDIVGFDVVRCANAQQPHIIAEASRLLETENGPKTGLISSIVFASDDGTRICVGTRWKTRDAYETFVRSPAFRRALGADLAGATSEDIEGYHLATVVAHGGEVTHDPSFPMN